MEAPLPQAPVQAPYRHLTNLLQTYRGNAQRVFAYLRVAPEASGYERLETRTRCAWNWTEKYAPEDFRFTLRGDDEPPLAVDETQRRALARLRREIETKLDSHDEASLSTAVYDIAKEIGLESKDLFRLAYQALIGQDRGPRLAGFLLTIGKPKLLALLKGY